jgi:hypothetical protein
LESFNRKPRILRCEREIVDGDVVRCEVTKTQNLKGQTRRSESVSKRVHIKIRILDNNEKIEGPSHDSSCR